MNVLKGVSQTRTSGVRSPKLSGGESLTDTRSSCQDFLKGGDLFSKRRSNTWGRQGAVGGVSWPLTWAGSGCIPAGRRSRPGAPWRSPAAPGTPPGAGSAPRRTAPGTSSRWASRSARSTAPGGRRGGTTRQQSALERALKARGWSQRHGFDSCSPLMHVLPSISRTFLSISL